MKKIFSYVLVLTLIILLGMIGPMNIKADYEELQPDRREHLPKVFYLVPHQDDELLTFGPSLLNHAKGNNDVHMVLMTDGSSTSAIKGINNKLLEEGKAPITKQELSIARDREFREMAMIFGLDESKVWTYDYVDGQLTKEDVRGIIEDILAVYPDARIKTTSYLDWHNDHKVAGQALQEMYDEGIVKDARFYLKNSQFGTDRIPGVQFVNGEKFRPFLDAGIEVYSYWNPEVGRYSVGRISTSSFDILKENSTVKYHVPGWKPSGK